MKSLLFLSTFFTSLLFPLLAFAQAPLVTCQDKCTFCDLIATGNRVVQYITVLAFTVVVLFIAWSAIQMMVSGGNQSKFESAKKSITIAITGLLIILVSWIFISELLSVLAGEGGTLTPWNEIPCSTSSVTPTASTNRGGNTSGGNPGPPAAVCNDNRQLAAHYGTSYPFIESTEIRTIGDCILNNLVASGDAGMVDMGQIYTYERTNPKCNLTRGRAVCGITSCQHSINSCHYGGASGTQSLAVDFNAATGHSEQELNQVIKLLAPTCGFSASDVINEGNHTHISAPSCR